MYLILSGSAIDAFENHYWYLTKNIVPLALWSNKVLPQERNTVTNSTPATKSNITDAAFKSQGRYGMNFRKPEFPKKNLTVNTTISGLVGEGSWFLFYPLELYSVFLIEGVFE